MEKQMYDNPLEFEKDVDEIFAVLYARGAREATPLVEKFKEKYAVPDKRSPEDLPALYPPGKNNQ